MPRKKQNKSDNYNKPFPSALRALMEKNNTTQQTLADVLGVSRQQISVYCDGGSSPSLESLALIAQFFGVTTDYLLGLTDDPSPRPIATDELFLSPDAVFYLAERASMDEIALIDEILNNRLYAGATFLSEMTDLFFSDIPNAIEWENSWELQQANQTREMVRQAGGAYLQGLEYCDYKVQRITDSLSCWIRASDEFKELESAHSAMMTRRTQAAQKRAEATHAEYLEYVENCVTNGLKALPFFEWYQLNKIPQTPSEGIANGEHQTN